MNLLLLSSSRVGQTQYLEHAESLLTQHIGSKINEVIFIPYAGVTIDYDAYEKMVSPTFSKLGYTLKSIHQCSDPVEAIEQAQAIAVGGGNTFCLLNQLYQNELIAPLKKKVSQGTPYIGWSAGSNITAPTIKTTNDMPIVEPPSFKALNFIPFQLNPHYIDGNPPGHNGETREQRISEFLKANPQQTVVGIPEGSALIMTDKGLKYFADKQYVGDKSGYIFSAKDGKQPILSETCLNHLI